MSIKDVNATPRSQCDAAAYSLERKKSIYVDSHGCAANKFDLEIMLAHLNGAGYQFASDIHSSDIILINTCGVKKPTEDRMLERLRAYRRLDKPLVIAGCLPRINRQAIIRAAPKFSVMLDPQSIDKIVLAAEAAEMGERGKIFFSQRAIPKLDRPKVRLNSVIEIVLISEGCAGACAYCCVKLARGALFSYPLETIAGRVRQAVSEGVKEIWLTSQDNGAYGLDCDTNLVELIKECCKIQGRFLIRVGMMNPDRALRMLPDLIDAYKNERVFKFLHLPVQSGDDETLSCMNRRYTVGEFKEAVKVFREAIPDVSLATDLICGFPGESDEAFNKTLRLIEEVQPDAINISKFYPRPNTPAERMTQLDVQEVITRSRQLTALAKSVSSKRNQRWLNWQGKMLVDEKGKAFSWIGRNFAYKPIVVKSHENLLGEHIHVRVVKTYATYLEAEQLARAL